MYHHHEFIKELFKLASYAVGFGYSLFAGLIVGRTQKLLYTGFEEGKIPEWRSLVTGLVERWLYTASILAGFPEFVGVWLGVKAISHWEIFKSDYNSSPKKNKIMNKGNARSIFNGYFVGTGLSIAYGSAGAFIATSLIDCHILSAIALAVGLVVAHISLNGYICCKANKEPSAEQKKWSHRNLAKIANFKRKR